MGLGVAQYGDLPMRAKEVRLALGVEIEREVLAEGGTRDDIKLVLEEDPGFVKSLGNQLLEHAKIIRIGRGRFRILEPEVAIEMPALKRPTLEELKKNWSGVHSIRRDDSTEEPVTLRLVTVLRTNESSISGEIYVRRLAQLQKKKKLLGFQHCEWLLKNQLAHPALMALLTKIYIDFPGIVIENSSGRLEIPYVRQYRSRFSSDWCGFNDMNYYGRIAIASSR
jgi:hypothetical protein